MYALRYASSFLKEAKKDAAAALSCGRPDAKNDCLAPHYFIISDFPTTIWTGVGGWARAYLEIQTELHAFQVQETARYYTPSVDQSFAAESKTSLLHIFHANRIGY